MPEINTPDPTLILGSPAVAAQAPAGLYAGRYQIERLVGRGGMGAVYRAVDVVVGDVVALKILDTSITDTPQILEWFRREVRLARRISHPNVARTHDMGEQGGARFITMEFIEGKTLEEVLYTREPNGVLRSHPMEPARAAAVALAVCDGLAAAHAAGVIHRDLKPANILIEHTGRVVITDFGIARGLADEAGRTQGMVGTPLYMSPEQVSGRPVDARTDLYALGLTFFEMLVGAPPFTGDTPLLAAMARIERPPPDPRALRPDVPESLALLVLQCMAQEPDQRPAGADEVAARLRGFLGESPAPAASAAGLSLPAVERGDVASRRTPGTLPRTQPTLAVLPLRFQGPADMSYLADAIADELIDVLSRTRGLRILGSGATARFRDNRDPKALGAELGVDAVIEATLQCSPTQVRVLARLVEVATGVQWWSDRFESRIDDLFEVPDRVSKRIAEALRVELTTSAHRGDASPEAVALHLRARRKLYAMHILGADGAVELLEACLALAPRFLPALANHAVACVRAWFITRSLNGELSRRDLEGDARRSVALALELAPDLAETHLARGMLAVQTGEWRVVVQALSTALEIAPAYPHAHQYLAQLQCEAGNTREGAPRAKLAADLEPSLTLGLLEVARVHALRGELDEYERIVARIEANPPYRFPTLQLRMRVATWYGDLELPRRILADLHGDPLAGYHRILIGYGRSVLGDVSKEEMDAFVHDLLREQLSPRLTALLRQLCCEVYCSRGYPADALEHFREAAATVLTDIEWVDRCPLLKPMRALPGFDSIRRKVRVRVDSMWTL